MVEPAGADCRPRVVARLLSANAREATRIPAHERNGVKNLMRLDPTEPVPPTGPARWRLVCPVSLSQRRGWGRAI